MRPLISKQLIYRVLPPLSSIHCTPRSATRSRFPARRLRSSVAAVQGQVLSRKMSTNQEPKILSTEELSSEAKWLKLERINWQDQEGKKRVWEAANRTTRKGPVDSVHILALLHHPSKPVSTIIIEQYRPPTGATVIELPAGLVDEGEDAATTALRELHEETGYGSGKEDGSTTVKEVSSVLVKDPGMTGANFQLVTVNVKVGENDSDPQQHLDEGEHIVKRIVPLKDLYDTLEDYSSKGFAVDGLLSSIALGWKLSSEYSA